MEFRTAITGFPRIGENRELKKALESYWSGKIPLSELSQTAADLRKKHWTEQKSRGIDLISVNDFSFYDIMLDTAIMLGAVPARFAGISEPFDRCFSMARGGDDCAAMEMTKWFNTNYHYIVPELEEGMALSSDVSKIENEYKEAKALGITPKINIVGPITFTALSKCRKGLDVFSFFDEIFSTYKALLEKISLLDEKVIVQMEEPVFCLDSYNDKLSLLEKTYASFSSISERLGIIVTGYFEHFSEAVKVLSSTGIMGLGLDFVYGKKNMESLSYIKDKVIFAGVVDGRNIWKNDLKKSLGLLDDISKVVPKDRIIVSTSCSLLHVPYSVRQEPENKINGMFSFAVEKTEEVALLGKLFNDEDLTKDEDLFFKENTRINEEKKQASAGLAGMAGDRAKKGSGKYREGAFSERIKLQKELFKLPDLPTTTIGSFPQTPELRKVRRDYKKGIIESGEYKENIRKYIDECILFQEESGLDVLVHGEPERNDMVEYFGELLKGFHFTSNGWVQSYGSRCVKPPVIYGDVSRPYPMTVEWLSYAQSRTKKRVKGMLTGPVTIINWSFVRDDIPRSETAMQIALALADEISDLQEHGIKIIQVDEAAFKEGYPLRKEDIPAYEKWALDSFRLSVSSAEKDTQIHTHMCYSEFNDIMKTIEAMDADVITIETARSGNELLKIFNETGYKNEIGPGVYDIHSPRVPDVSEFKKEINERLKVVEREKMWVNPDCGLKTRKWEEVRPALINMVKAVREIRE